MQIVIGTGAVAAEISMFFQVDGYLEYDYNIDNYYKKYHLMAPILGDIDNYEIRNNDCFILGMADISFRNKVIQKIKSRGGYFRNHIHSTAIVSNFMKGEGNVIYPHCIASINVEIGNFNLLTCQSILSHDCKLGDNNILATSLLCGNVKAGSDNMFGIRSTVLPDISIGSRNTIQAGMIVDKDLKDDSTVFYRYKEKLIYERL